MENEIINSDYKKTFKQLKERVLQAQYKSYSAVNSEMILAYLDIGKVISEKTKSGWGTSVIIQLSKDLRAEFPGVKGFSERNLRLMRFIYEEVAENPIWQQLVAKLHWGHTVMIFSKIKNREQRTFYLQKTKEEAWSRSILEEKIKIDLYSQRQKFQNNFDKALTTTEIAENLPNEAQLKSIFSDE